MATLYAVPTADNWDVADTNNYSTTDGGPGGGGVPANGDTVIWKQGTYQPGSSNLDQSAVTLTALYILGGFGGTRSGIQIPNSSNPYKINATTLVIQSERIANINLFGAFTTIECRQLKNGVLTLSGGSVTTFRGGSTGHVQIGDDVECTLFETAGMSFEILADATSPGDLQLILSRAARGTCARKVSTGKIDGDLTLKDAATIAISAGSTDVTVGNTGKLRLNNSGAMGIVRAMGGALVTTKGTPGFATPPTLTTLLYHDGALIDIPTGSLTITNKTPIGGYDFSSGPVTVI